ncbi:MAG: hypothetical protein SFU25_02685 [Candidatus Caenarcaniphilales bacterium]|nr:hypothetical protein [Candidatus Caenarcaniphilales bacterium]
MDKQKNLQTVKTKELGKLQKVLLRESKPKPDAAQSYENNVLVQPKRSVTA